MITKNLGTTGARGDSRATPPFWHLRSKCAGLPRAIRVEEPRVLPWHRVRLSVRGTAAAAQVLWAMAYWFEGTRGKDTKRGNVDDSVSVWSCHHRGSDFATRTGAPDGMMYAAMTGWPAMPTSAGAGGKNNDYRRLESVPRASFRFSCALAFDDGAGVRLNSTEPCKVAISLLYVHDCSRALNGLNLTAWSLCAISLGCDSR